MWVNGRIISKRVGAFIYGFNLKGKGST